MWNLAAPVTSANAGFDVKHRGTVKADGKTICPSKQSKNANHFLGISTECLPTTLISLAFLKLKGSEYSVSFIGMPNFPLPVSTFLCTNQFSDVATPFPFFGFHSETFL